MTDTIKEKDRQLLIEFAEFQWNKLSLDLKLQLVGTVFNNRTVNDFFSQRESREEKKDSNEIARKIIEADNRHFDPRYDGC